MKRPRSEDFATLVKKKKTTRGKKEVEKVKEQKGENHIVVVKKEEKRESRDFGSEFGSAEKDSGRVWSTWEELYSSWAWQSNVVDEQMSWGSVWLPVWDLDIVGEAFDALYSDVVWDDDIWDLRNQIPYPYM